MDMYVFSEWNFINYLIKMVLGRVVGDGCFPKLSFMS